MCRAIFFCYRPVWLCCLHFTGVEPPRWSRLPPWLRDRAPSRGAASGRGGGWGWLRVPPSGGHGLPRVPPCGVPRTNVTSVPHCSVHSGVRCGVRVGAVTTKAKYVCQSVPPGVRTRREGQGCIRTADNHRRRGGTPRLDPLPPGPRFYCGKKYTLQTEILICANFWYTKFWDPDPPPPLFSYISWGGGGGAYIFDNGSAPRPSKHWFPPKNDSHRKAQRAAT